MTRSTLLAVLFLVALVAATSTCANVGDFGYAAKLPVGATCGSSNVCASGNCVDGFCCAGTSCTHELVQGRACTANDQCATGNCVDGVCCATACNSACQVCVLGTGVCGDIAAGQTDSNPTCSGSNRCNGAGACVSMCSDTVKDDPETDIDCGGSCSTKCAVGKGCSSNLDCASAFCNTTTNLCSPPCWVEIATGGYHTCARKSDGSVWCWGGNEYGQVDGARVSVGDGVHDPAAIKASPVQVTALGTSAAEIAAGYTHTCARRGDGSVWCWGGWTENVTPAPVQVRALGTSVVEIADTCARKGDGSVWCWGWNKSSPVQATALGTSVVELTGTCARKGDGSVWCWERNRDGVVDAVQVTALGTSAVEIATGAGHTCARKGDGSVWCWGKNDRGQVGDGTTSNKTSPVQVTTLGTSAVEIATGHQHTCARKGDGSVWCWGKNDRGQIGDGTTNNKTSPVQVTALGTSAVDIAAGGNHTCARKGDGSVWCWGWNDWGQLGDGTKKNKLSPVLTMLACP